jgi:UDP-N-acetylmuramoyl-L-alanyl-D-glutamate--2,6-diaminopimelate ligase
LTFKVDSDWGIAEIDTSLLGEFNVENLVLVLGVLLGWGMPFGRAVNQLHRLRSIPGRMEVFGGSSGLPLVAVDYAHTPDALEKALVSLRSHTAARLICVFGCGGDRDRGKRPLMAAAAERHADAVWLTDDNPRHEDSRQIFADIMSGFKIAETVNIERDRGRAIRAAVRRARAGDVVLVAGKGHEHFQQVGDLRYRFSDAQQVRDVLRELAL